jgi:hypothetical protein
MKDDLDLFVSALEEVQTAVKNEQPLAEQILRWLKSLFKAITSILATVCPRSGHPILHSGSRCVLNI